MVNKGRVLYYGKFGELYIERGKFEEQLVYISPNRSGFSGSTLKSIEEQANSAIVAATELKNVLNDLKERVNERAPAMFGYDDYVSDKVRREEEEMKTRDKVLSDLKAYSDEGGAI